MVGMSMDMSMDTSIAITTVCPWTSPLYVHGHVHCVSTDMSSVCVSTDMSTGMSTVCPRTCPLFVHGHGHGYIYCMSMDMCVSTVCPWTMDIHVHCVSMDMLRVSSHLHTNSCGRVRVKAVSRTYQPLSSARKTKYGNRAPN